MTYQQLKEKINDSIFEHVSDFVDAKFKIAYEDEDKYYEIYRDIHSEVMESIFKSLGK